ncbi:MAG TPA: hypothetical protein VME70_15950 [Mycobacteriales bacterium]|nr:hypothetical protein [Mycobacteriales bacterium]
MELTVRPRDLSAAAVALRRSSTRLGDAGTSFCRLAHADVPDLGTQAGPAIGRTVARAEQVVHALVDDVERLADALTALADLYPAVDQRVVEPR